MTKSPYREAFLLVSPCAWWVAGSSTLSCRCPAAPSRKPMWSPLATRLETTRCQKGQASNGISSPIRCEDKDSRGSILQPPHPLLLHCGSFKRQILHSEGRQRESTSDRSFVKRCISFGSHFHPSHPSGSVPCCSSSPEGWIFSASLLRGRDAHPWQRSPSLSAGVVTETYSLFSFWWLLS